MKRVFCLTLLLFAFAACVSAQEKTIQKAEFDSVYKNSFAKFKGKPYRMITTSQNSLEGRPQSNVTIKSIIEFTSSDTSHYTYELNSQSINSKSEMIKIGDKTYTRERDGEWKEGKPEAESPSENKPKSVEARTEYKFLGRGMLNEQNASIYEMIERKKLVNPWNNMETLSSRITKYWFGEDGRLLKAESETENRVGEMIFHNQQTIVYELDPNIKIKAPKLK